MFGYATPEEIGISSKKILDFYKFLDEHQISAHSLIMARGNKIFTEGYWKPFDCNFKHRMYSVSKSFVSIAVGFAVQDGLIALEDKFIKYFPEYDDESLHEYFKMQTIEDMLKMRTCKSHCTSWFLTNTKNRIDTYFMDKPTRMPDMMFDYDSSGSYMLGVIVERVTGKPFLEYLKEKVLIKAGFSKDAYCIQCPGGNSFGDSGVMCTIKDMLIFARFVMDKGKIDGVSYLDEKYIEKAIESHGPTNVDANFKYNDVGYGYQIWKMGSKGYAFIGMGDQLAICVPEKDFIFAINSDNQGNPHVRQFMLEKVFSDIVDNFDQDMEKNDESYKELETYINSLELTHLSGNTDSDFLENVNDVWYDFPENGTGISSLKIQINGNVGKLCYNNKQGYKELVFGMGYNEFSQFPQEGYSDLVATYSQPGHKYRCATSAVWNGERNLQIKCQIIDKYFGRLAINLGYRDNMLLIRMEKVAEAFLNEYEGCILGKKRGE